MQLSFQNINIIDSDMYEYVRTGHGTWNIAHVERQRSLKRGDLPAVHRELGRDEPIPRFLTHLLDESIHLGRVKLVAAVAVQSAPVQIFKQEAIG